MSGRKPAKAKTRTERLREGSQQRREQEKQEVRDAILRSASELFLEHGYDGFSIRKVAEHIGYSPGIIYFYFADKDEVLFTLVDQGFQQFAECLKTAYDSTDDPRERLMALSKAYIDFGINNPAHYQLMFMQRTDYLLRPIKDRPYKMLTFELFMMAVKDAMEKGLLVEDDVLRTSDAMWATMHGTVCLAILMPVFDAQRVENMVQKALQFVTFGIHL